MSILSRIAVDLHAFPRDQTIEKWYSLEDTNASLLLLITVSGSHSKDTVVDLTEFNQNDVRNSIVERYDLLHTFDDMKDIGLLTVKVFRAEDLIAKDIGGKSDPFAVLELVNTRLQTHTEYKTLNPQWNKLFTFSVKDIHTCLEVTIYDEDPNNKFEFLGKVSIPLLSASLFRNTVLQLKEYGLTIVDYKNYIESCFDWDSTSRSITAFVRVADEITLSGRPDTNCSAFCEDDDVAEEEKVGWRLS
ncbi:unnamed protein product [Angiostrongylus costaricensis]|uniref:C2 domain-containing protein n=1 Tax=Angiostrongylus costaricensis TaxID=334426 RepID=A0A158PIG7_ANGCS|nr:unnamed protein product [Angiostrongylus costaricensis]